MEAAAAEMVTVTAAEVAGWKDTIRQQKGQLALALGVLVSLGFDLDALLGNIS